MPDGSARAFGPNALLVRNKISCLTATLAFWPPKPLESIDEPRSTRLDQRGRREYAVQQFESLIARHFDDLLGNVFGCDRCKDGNAVAVPDDEQREQDHSRDDNPRETSLPLCDAALVIAVSRQQAAERRNIRDLAERAIGKANQARR